MEDNCEPEPIDSEDSDYRFYREGMRFKPLDKEIKILIVVEKYYIVFLDPDLHVHYYNSDDYGDLPQGCGDVLAREADLEATSSLLLTGSSLEAHRRLLGESVARLYADDTVVHANAMLRKAAKFLQARSRERARWWYLSAAIRATAVMLLLGMILWIRQQQILGFLAFEPGAVEVLLGASMGSLGALISVLLRSDKLKTDASAGPFVHHFEGTMRILIGALAGLLFVLAVKSNVLLGMINRTDKSLTLSLSLAIVAGASEQLLPNLIRQMSGVLVGDQSEDDHPDKDEEAAGDDKDKQPPTRLIRKTHKI